MKRRSIRRDVEESEQDERVGRKKGGRTTQDTREPEPNDKSKNAPKQVDRFVAASIPKGPRLKSVADMLYSWRVTPSQQIRRNEGRERLKNLRFLRKSAKPRHRVRKGTSSNLSGQSSLLVNKVPTSDSTSEFELTSVSSRRSLSSLDFRIQTSNDISRSTNQRSPRIDRDVLRTTSILNTIRNIRSIYTDHVHRNHPIALHSRRDTDVVDIGGVERGVQVSDCEGSSGFDRRRGRNVVVSREGDCESWERKDGGGVEVLPEWCHS